MGFGSDCDRLVHGRARRARGHDRARDDPRRSRRTDRNAGMDRQRLQSDLRGAAVDRRRARRPVRAAADVRRGAVPVHGGVPRLRACRQRNHADRGARRSGCGSRADHAARDGAVERRLSARGTRQGARHFLRHHRACADRRAGRGRRDRRGPRLALDLLAQPPRRPRCAPARSAAGSRRAAAPTRRSTSQASRWRAARRWPSSAG